VDDSGGSYHSEVTDDVSDDDVSGVEGVMGASWVGDVGLGNVGVGGGAFRKRSLRKSSCVRDARRRRDRDIVPDEVGEGWGDGAWDESNASSKYK